VAYADDSIITNQGDAARAERAANALLQVLLTDSRVIQAFSECLNLPYPWLAVFLAWAYVGGKSVSGERPLVELSALPRGRQPWNDGDYIRRDAEWYYRSEIKVPRETVYSIAKTDLDMNGKAPNHSQVDTAIARTKKLLRVRNKTAAIAA
jgi:hypothetical protein